METNRRTIRSTRGQALVEFAVVLPLLFIVIMGVVEFSRAMFAYQWAGYAAHAAARYASIHGSSYATKCPTTSPFTPTNNCKVDSTNTANVTLYVKNTASGVYLNGGTSGSGGLTVTTTWPGSTGNPTGCTTTNGTNSPGCPVNVVVKYNYGFQIPFINLPVKTMTSTAQLTISR